MADATLIKSNPGGTAQGLECPLCRKRGHQHVMAYPGRSALFRNRTIARCVGCGLVYTYPMTSTETLNAYYNSGTFWGHVSDTTPFDIPTYHHQAKARVEFITARAQFSNNTDVLDIGAGYGVLETYLRKMMPAQVNCFAVEPDQKAQQSLEKNDVRWSADLEGMGEKTFDLIILSHVFEHINDPVGYLRKLRANCKGNGYLFIEVPNEDYRFKPALEPHVLFFSPKTLGSVLAAGGFKALHVETCGLQCRDQRVMEDQIRRRNEWIRRLPFRNQLRQLKSLFASKAGGTPSSDPLSVPDRFDCAVYGDDRIWIRCLAKLQA